MFSTCLLHHRENTTVSNVHTLVRSLVVLGSETWEIEASVYLSKITPAAMCVEKQAEWVLSLMDSYRTKWWQMLKVPDGQTDSLRLVTQIFTPEWVLCKYSPLSEFCVCLHLFRQNKPSSAKAQIAHSCKTEAQKGGQILVILQNTFRLWHIRFKLATVFGPLKAGTAHLKAPLVVHSSAVA